jgi:beta-galactosidase/beta-glucuronidase
MKAFSGLDSFWPYDSIDDIYQKKIQPEFGLVPSDWHFDLPTWRFLHAENRDMVPIGFELPTFPDDTWDAVQLPSVWQQEGYGLPASLSYDARTQIEGTSFWNRLKAKLNMLTSSDVDDDVGVYRSWIVLPPSFAERVVYFSGSGIRGRFELYVNGQLVIESEAWYSQKKVLISPYLQGENNLLTLLIYRLESEGHDRIPKENGTFGFSGIFRVPEIVAESFVEMSGLRIQTSWIDNAHMNLVRSVAQTMRDSSDIMTDADAKADGRGLSDIDLRSNGRLRIKVVLHNHSDYAMRIRVECGILETRTEYDIYHLPEIRVSMVQPLEGKILPGISMVLESELYADRVLPWTDQTPNLYDLVLKVIDDSDRVICVKKRRIGFRTTEVRGRAFRVNDIALPLRAVRYFDFDPVCGLAVPADRMRQDVCLMKQANINTVLVAHFPSDPIFYQLCDQYGLYVISQSEPMHMHEMMESLMTHPCIISWSFAPYHVDISALVEYKKKLMMQDTGRPFYCENDHAGKVSDIPSLPSEAGSYFGEWSDICVDRAVLASKLEPGHTIYDTQIGKKREEKSPECTWLHQGDLEEFHDKNDVPIAQGIVGADRIPHPIYYEVKKQCETLAFIISSENPADVVLRNLHPFGETSDLTLYWQLLLGGIRLRGGHGLVRSLPPLGEKAIRFPFILSDYQKQDWMLDDPDAQRVYEAADSDELVFDVRVYLAADTHYALAGHEIAFYQQVLLQKVAGQGSKMEDQEKSEDTTAHLASLVVRSRPDALQIAQSSMTIAISRNSGGLSSITCGALEYIAGSMQPSFYRGATNSDRMDRSFVLAATVFSKETDWRSIQKDLQSERLHYEMKGDDFSMQIHYKSAAFKDDVLVEYLMSPVGKLSVTLSFTPRYDLLRSGFRVRIPKTMNRLSWYGRGLHEAYPDRKESARFGFFESSPDELHHEYARPQENGSHCDTQYLLLSDGSGKGLKITSGGTDRFSFTATPYTPEDMDDFQHQEELQSDDAYELFLDFYMKGIQRNGRESHQFVKNQSYRGTFVFAPWQAVKQEPTDPESL